MDGGGGQMSSLDISFLLASPDGQTLLSDYKQSRGDHQLTAAQEINISSVLNLMDSFILSGNHQSLFFFDTAMQPAEANWIFIINR